MLLCWQFKSTTKIHKIITLFCLIQNGELSVWLASKSFLGVIFWKSISIYPEKHEQGQYLVGNGDSEVYSINKNHFDVVL